MKMQHHEIRRFMQGLPATVLFKFDDTYWQSAPAFSCQCCLQKVQRHHAAPTQCINLTSMAPKNDEVSPTSLERLSNTPYSAEGYNFSDWMNMEFWTNVRY